jgi:hypothetical protein
MLCANETLSHRPSSFLAALEHHKMKQAGQEIVDQYAPKMDN